MLLLSRQYTTARHARVIGNDHLISRWPWPTAPWERVHIDFAGPFMGYMYLVVVDSHFKRVEIMPMKSTTTEKTLEVSRELSAHHGLPKQLISDNGPQFTTKEFEECMCANGVKHSRIRSAPYHPATNGEAERFVQTFKRSLQAGRSDAGTIPVAVSTDVSHNTKCNHWIRSCTCRALPEEETPDSFRPPATYSRGTRPRGATETEEVSRPALTIMSGVTTWDKRFW